MGSPEPLRVARRILSSSRSVVVLTGAGVSAESGIPAFRGPGGLWERFDVDRLASWEGFSARPDEGWRFYDMRRQAIAGCAPNAGHVALAEYERRMADAGGSFTLLTQNVDGLHQRAGSGRVIEVHGSIWKVRCPKCDHEERDDRAPLPSLPPLCRRCGHWLRPGVVLFGELLDPRDVAEATAAAERCEVMIVAGTSALVYPAAGLPVVAKRAGARVIEVNTEKTPLSDLADASVRAASGEALPRILSR